MVAGLERALATRRAMAIVIAAVMAIAATSIAIGFLTDDRGFRAALHSTSANAPAAYDLFRFVPGDPANNQLRVRFGRLPWWSAPDLKIHFIRPLTSLAFAADDRLFDDAPLGFHLTSLAWYLALLIAAAAVFRRLLPPAAATLALAVFGLSAAHVGAYAWISARHVVIAGALSAAALAARWSRRRWLAPCVLAVALAASEAALAVVPLWIALELAGLRRRSAPPGEPVPWRARALACLPPLVLASAYLVGYAALGAGTRGSGGYHDPMSDPLGFAWLALRRVPILLGDAALGIPAELAHAVSEWWLALAGAIAVGVVALAWWLTAPRAAADGAGRGHGIARLAETERSPADPAAGGGSGISEVRDPRKEMCDGADMKYGVLAVGGAAATVLGVAGYPAGRMLVIPDLAFAAVLGLVLYRGLRARWPGRVLAGALAIVHLVLAPLGTLRSIDRLAERARATDAVAERVRQLAAPATRVFIVAASDPMVFLYPRGILADVAPDAVRCWSVWSAAHAGHRITRTGAHTLVIEPVERPLLDGSFDELFRSPDRPFAVGDSVEQCGATIRVAALRDGHPSRLEIELRRSLYDPEIALLVWRAGQLERMAPPRPGETIEVPWSRGPSGL